jgi:hypothetical protein
MPPPPRSSPQIPAILKLGHMMTPTPPPLPRGPTLPPRPQKKNGSRHTWPRRALLLMRRASTLYQHQQHRRRRPCVRRRLGPSRQIAPLAANLRWATYHTRRRFASRLRARAGTRPCTGQGHSYLLPRQRIRGPRLQRLSAPSCRP